MSSVYGSVGLKTDEFLRLFFKNMEFDFFEMMGFERPHFSHRIRAPPLLDPGRATLESDPFGLPIYDYLKNIKEPRTLTNPKSAKPCGKQNYSFAEKYKPKRFIDLIGSDVAHRRIMLWLSKWKSIAFGQRVEDTQDHDPYGRPSKKILLVHGPPGCGKSSAVRTMVKQHKFHIYDLDVIADTCEDRLKAALSNNHATARSPTCVVIDDIDGADGRLIRAIINAQKSDDYYLAKKKRGKLLRRPIIVICNDLWAPHIRELLQYSQVVSFTKHTPGQLYGLLEHICREESLVVPPRQLHEIILAADADLRMCLSIIQYDLASGGSDRKANWVRLAADVFTGSCPSIEHISTCEQIDTLLGACFNMYTQSGSVDDRFSKSLRISEWLALCDFSKPVGLNQYYAPCAILAFSYLFWSKTNSPQVQKMPNSFDSQKQILATLHDLSRTFKSCHSRMQLLLELCPYIIRLACPHVAAVLTQSDKKKLKTCAEGLEAAGISFRRTSTDSGYTALKLSPPLEIACLFNEESQVHAAFWRFSTRIALCDAMKELHRCDPVLSTGSEMFANATSKASLSLPTKRKRHFLEKENAQRRETNKVWIQYTEGFSNAVRKRVKWNELFM